MARSVYVKATQERGAEFCESASGWAGLDNRKTPAKISKALALVGIDVAQMEITFHGTSGYDITCSAKIIEELDALHHRILNPLPAGGASSRQRGRNVRG
jgi:hypothetical protein